MTVSVLVPFNSSGCDWRDRAWAHVREHYQQHHNDWELVVGATPAPWSKGAAVRSALEQASGDVLVIADADSFTSPDVLAEAVTAMEQHHWVVPHGVVYRLGQHGTNRIYRGQEAHKGHVIRMAYAGPPGGGITVLRRSAYDAVRGIDDRFLGWGGEDVSFGWALETLVEPVTRLAGALWHLWHPHPAPNLRGSPESDALVARYTEARCVPRLMRAMVDRCDPAPVEPLEAAAVFGCSRSLVHAGGRTVRFVDGSYATTDPDMASALRFVADVEEVGGGVLCDR